MVGSDTGDGGNPHISSTRRSHPPVDPDRSFGPRDIPALATGAVRLVWNASRREAVILAVMVVLQGAGVFFLLFQIAKLLGGLVDSEAGADTPRLPVDVALLIAANGVMVTAAAVINNRRQLLGERVGMYAQGRLLEVASVAELDDYDDAGFHDRLRRAVQSADRPMGIVESILHLLQALTVLVAAILGLLFMQPWIALCVALAVVPIWIGGLRGGEHYFDFVVDTTQGDRRRTYLFELLTSRDSIREIKAFGTGDHFSSIWHRLMTERLDRLMVALRRRFRTAMVAALGSNLIIALVVGLLIALNQADVMTLGETAATGTALLLVSQRLIDLIQFTNDFFDDAPLVQDLQDFLTLQPALLEQRPTGTLPAQFDVVEVDDIAFAYKTGARRAVDGVSLRLRAGEVVALVGENGSGKTTLAKLLSGLYPPDGGRILVDGVDLATTDPASWRAAVAVVFQDYLHYALPARDNIRVGSVSREPTDEAIREAARAAGVDEYLASLPAGYDTVLSPEFDDGQDLSLGQWQRVALARAFFRSAPLVILDEPTASLDARAEQALFDTVRELYEGRTVLLISHRFSTVRTADRIVVLAAGQVVEEGTHEQLMQAGGLYAELFTMQASNYVDVGSGPTDPKTEVTTVS